MSNRILLAIVLATGLTGCASHFDDKDAAGNKRDSFETSSKDPAINAETRYAAGQLAESQNSLAHAIEQYEWALRANPKHLGALYRLGILNAELKEYPKAIEYWQQYLKATDRSAGGYSNLGFCYELAGQPEQAEEAYKRGIKRDPKFTACRINYGLMLARFDRIAEATLQLQSVLTPAEVHYNLASVYEAKGRKEQARAEYQTALQLDPKFNEAQARLDAIK